MPPSRRAAQARKSSACCSIRSEDLDAFLDQLLDGAKPARVARGGQANIPDAAKQACCASEEIVRLLLDQIGGPGRLPRSAAGRRQAREGSPRRPGEHPRCRQAGVLRKRGNRPPVARSDRRTWTPSSISCWTAPSPRG